VVDLTRCDDEVVGVFRREAGDSGYGVILDSVWGHPTGLLLQALILDAVTPEVVGEATRQVWEWIAAEKLEAAIEPVALHEIERAWLTSNVHGSRCGHRALARSCHQTGTSPAVRASLRTCPS
jgi:NADPH2:quinone reductase